MKRDNIYQYIQKKRGEGKQLIAVLIDPDKQATSELAGIVAIIEAYADIILVGGSLLLRDRFDACISTVKSLTSLPVVIFPGSPQQISSNADAILLLSLISGRNPDLLIGQQVIAAPLIKESGIEVLSTGYILVESGRQTTASYISQTIPMPAHKPEIAACTALAAEQLGMKLIYLDGGSGALNPVPGKMIATVRKTIDIPLIVGGGIKTAEQAAIACNSGADVVVVGTAFEENTHVLKSISEMVRRPVKTVIN
ncbi:MAG: geranylgeranylglyceryl/heptaprenylglyceryl phosphate synthase [Bacteroidetes bacterium]|nr:geranylgeranylglyceryl/heptaprenylglyceryl phosphate synthase [Bacteroidota bacterium]